MRVNVAVRGCSSLDRGVCNGNRGCVAKQRGATVMECLVSG